MSRISKERRHNLPSKGWPENFPRLADYEAGLEEGFIDAAELTDSGVPDDTKSVIRVRLKVAPRLDEFPYFLGYALGHELFAVYLRAGRSKR